MKKILLGTLTVLALSPALLFARHSDGTEVEIHKSTNQSSMIMSGSMSTWHHGTGTTSSGWTAPGRTNTGALIDANMRALHADMAKLTPEQKIGLTKLIREYLITQGITPSTPELKVSDAERKGWDGSIKGKKTVNELKTEQKQKLEEVKAKREALKTASNDFNSSRSNREKGN